MPNRFTFRLKLNFPGEGLYLLGGVSYCDETIGPPIKMRIYVTGRDVTKTSARNSTHLVRPDIGYQALELTGNYVFFYLYMLLFYCKKIILIFDKKLHVHRNKKKKKRLHL